MKKVLFIIINATFLLACSNGNIESIETAACSNGNFPGQGAYLVNTSKNKKIQFTIKSYLHDQSNVVTNALYTLEPGAQIFLGCTTLAHYYHYEIVGEREIK